ncbi:methyl-accepting chemotaxis protein [bacterium]|nr:methyl-accepting chemotaxis protein [bacterium]
MVRRFRVQQKILVPYLGSILLLFVLFSCVTLFKIRNQVQHSVMTEAQDMLGLNVAEIRGFFVERGRIPRTLFEDPFILQWFMKYRIFRAPVANDPDYHRIITLFQNLLAADSTLNSVYFATENTQEYFDEEGRYEEDGYYVKDRPWWHKAVQMRKLYCELSGYDYEDSTMAASLQMPVFLSDGRLLGVGGVDIEIQTISRLVERMKYHGEGQAFMVDESGKTFVFPGQHPDLWYMQTLDVLDDAFNARGFQELGKQMRQNLSGEGHIVWHGVSHLVLFANIHSNQPYFRSQLAFMIPEHLITTQVRRMTWETMRLILLAGILVVVFGTMQTLKVIRPLDALSSRLHMIANEKPDLTQELPVTTHDAIGQTAKNFNIFLKQIHKLVTALVQHTKDTALRTNQLHGSYQSISDGSQHMSESIEQVATTSKEMVLHVEEVMQGVKEVARLSKQFLEIIGQGKDLVKTRMQKMGEITQGTISLFEDMKKLHADSNDLIQMVKVIEDINNRIALLSINASIEAVKAGERGRGFAIVAKEIESLSQGTAQTNQQTLQVVQSFSESMERFQHDLQNMKESMEIERRSFTAISEMFMYLADHAHHADEAAEQMQIENQQQVESLRMINESIQDVFNSARQVADSIAQSEEQIGRVYEQMQNLQKSAEAFKID